MGSEVETAGVGVLAPMGTIPISSGRKEGEGVARAGPEVSDVVVPRVAGSAVVWAEARELIIKAINKKPPQKGRLFLRSEI
jgi:hypothetical protein